MSEQSQARDVGFSELIGLHDLDAVDFITAKAQKWDDGYYDANAMAFRVDGKVYVVCEDESDGYRSSMEYLREFSGPVKNVFTPCRVLVRRRTEAEYGGSANVLEFLDVTTGKLVLELGTDNDDDYYPSYVASFHPENMAANAVAPSQA